MAVNAPPPQPPDRRRAAASIATNAGYLFAARFLAQALRAAYVIVLARTLGPELYGRLAYGQSWYTMAVPLAMLGLGTVLAHSAGRDHRRGAETLGRLLTLHGPLTLATALLSAGLGWVLNDDPEVRLLLVILSFALLGRAVSIMTEEIFAAFETSRLSLRQEAIFRPAEVILGLAILSLGGGIIEIALLHSAAQLAQGLRGVQLVRRYLRPVWVAWSWRIMTRLFLFGLLVGFSRIMSGWLLQGPLILYARSVSDQAPVGYLALVLQALALLCSIPWAIGSSSLPVLSRSSSHGGYADIMMRLAFVFAAVLGLAGMSVGPWLVARLLGAGYAQAGELLGPALWLILPLTAATVLNPLLLVRERYWAALLAAAAGAATMTLSFSALAAALGPLGALAAAGLGLSVWALVLLVLVARQGGVSLSLAVLRPAAAVSAAVVAYATLLEIGGGPWAGLAGAAIALAAAGLALATTPAERRAIGAFAKARWDGRRGG